MMAMILLIKEIKMMWRWPEFVEVYYKSCVCVCVCVCVCACVCVCVHACMCVNIETLTQTR